MGYSNKLPKEMLQLNDRECKQSPMNENNQVFHMKNSL